MQTVSYGGDNLYEMSNLFSRKKKNISPENFTQSAKH